MADDERRAYEEVLRVLNRVAEDASEERRHKDRPYFDAIREALTGQPPPVPPAPPAKAEPKPQPVTPDVIALGSSVPDVIPLGPGDDE